MDLLATECKGMLFHGVRVALAKFDQRDSSALQAIRFKVLLDPVLLVDVGNSGVLKNWYEWERQRDPAIAARMQPMPENRTYPDLLLDPLVDKLVKLS